MMIADFPFVYHRFNITRPDIGAAGQKIMEHLVEVWKHLRDAGRGVGRQERAVCAGVCRDLFFIECLGEIQCLLRRISQQFVGITLQHGKVIKVWRFLLFICPCYRDNGAGTSRIAGGGCSFGNRFILYLGICLKTSKIGGQAVICKR